MNGKGGGKAECAQASGNNYTKLKEAVDEARRVAAEHLNTGVTQPSQQPSSITCLSDVYNVRKLIAKEFSSVSGKQTTALNCNGPCYYLSDESFRGGLDDYSRASVLQWISFADFSLWPCINVKSKSKFDVKSDAYKKLFECLKYLNHVLETKTFLIYHKLSLADVAVLTCLLPLLHLDNDLKIVENEYVNVYRWFFTVYQHPRVRRYC